MNPVPNTMFTVNRIEKTVCTEASDIDYVGGPVTVDHAKFARTSMWYVTHVNRDWEGDLRFWELQPTAQDVQDWPALAGWTMTIFND